LASSSRCTLVERRVAQWRNADAGGYAARNINLSDKQTI
jgi:hypothetical protein